MDYRALSCSLYGVLALSVIAVGGCRSERELAINDWLSARSKTPPAGIAQLPPTASLQRNGTTMLVSRSIWFALVGTDASVAVHDHDSAFVGFIARVGDPINLREHGCVGMVLAPEGVDALDCWRDGDTAQFSLTRFGSDGRMVFRAVAPRAASDCGSTYMGYIGYDAASTPVAAYDCNVDGVRYCRALALGPSAGAEPIAEVKTSSATEACGNAMRSSTQWRAGKDVRQWTDVAHP